MRRHGPERTVQLLALLGGLFLAGCAGPPKPYETAVPEKTIKVEGISAPVTILLDRYGVPHITAGSEAEAAFAVGYMHGRDRRFQMELLRMDSLGRLRELLGSRVPPPWRCASRFSAGRWAFLGKRATYWRICPRSFGTNGNVAWGPTSNWADVTDLYVERPVPDKPSDYQTEKGDMPAPGLPAGGPGARAHHRQLLASEHAGPVSGNDRARSVDSA